MADGNGSGHSRVSGGRVDRLTATHVEATHAAVGSIESDTARLERAAVQRLRAANAHIERSNVGILNIGQGTLKGSNAGIVVAKSLAADEVRTAVLIAPVVRGEVHTLLDMRSAVAIGFGMALGKVVLSGLRRLGRR
ncbi:MAG: hypothetical protein ACKVT1_11415 [Dehalococcoidia bacterium]